MSRRRALLLALAGLALAGCGPVVGVGGTIVGSAGSSGGGGGEGESASADPVLLTEHDAGMVIDAIAISRDGTRAVIAGAGDGDHVQILSLDDPTAPVRLGGLRMPAGGGAGHVTLSPDERRAYASSVADGLVVVDISDPASPLIAGDLDVPFNSAQALAVAGDGAWGLLAAGDAGLHVVTLTASDPAIVGGYDVPDAAAAFAMLLPGESTGLLGLGWDGLHVLDLGDRSAPALLGLLPASTGAGLHVAARPTSDPSIVHVLAHRALLAVDLADPRFPAQAAIERLPDGLDYFCLAASPDGRTLYVGGDSVEVLDVADPLAPRRIGSYTAPAGRDLRIGGLAVSPDGRLGYAADERGLLILELPSR